uniref:Uncharacterized protein n=1 Tax=Chromera velia CCMP2878 TaxID=1169474 RepID=A0A0G4GLG4_9ALVE|eukprot:Cvel_22428.t1-p1 / transcript=Cvel_22428.t1 / gene=Cvel_22428 / organism=Chromera_velia_CCMP2878 / gene_product=hypothetical protein / transcript_product=hypothetical protein / location=Cvel_scaffold2202:20235-25256(-) / protein_length=77 / sequence_SO=supercontig / SO=protein_coding / is_pseudo=false
MEEQHGEAVHETDPIEEVLDVQAAHAVIHPIPKGHGQDLQMIDGTLQQEMSTNYEGPTATTGVLEPLTPLNTEMNTE